METKQHVSTVALARCGSCSNAIPETDKFCRMCGRRTGPAPAPWKERQFERRDVGELTIRHSPAIRYGGEEFASCQISGPLVKALIEAASPSLGSCCGVVKQGLVAIISLTVWIMIVLLAPFEAVATAKSIKRYR